MSQHLHSPTSRTGCYPGPDFSFTSISAARATDRGSEPFPFVPENADKKVQNGLIPPGEEWHPAAAPGAAPLASPFLEALLPQAAPARVPAVMLKVISSSSHPDLHKGHPVTLRSGKVGVVGAGWSCPASYKTSVNTFFCLSPLSSRIPIDFQIVPKIASISWL